MLLVVCHSGETTITPKFALDLMWAAMLDAPVDKQPIRILIGSIPKGVNPMIHELHTITQTSLSNPNV